ncbi:MAG: ABC transporter permease [Clostridia bacterium]
MFLAVSGILFSFTTLQKQSVNGMYEYFVYLLFVFAILIPLLTMKLLSEERKSKTEQILLTSPVSLFGIIVAKYFAAQTIFTASLLVNSLNFFLLYKYGTPNLAVILANILGIFLIGSAFIAVGLFLSALTENQLIAAVSSIGFISILLLISFVVQKIPFEWLRVIIKWFSVVDRYTPFTAGYLDIGALVYFISFTAVFIFLTVRVYEKRRWS